MTANRKSMKPAFLWVGNRLEYLDSFQVQSQPVFLDIKETTENSPDLHRLRVRSREINHYLLKVRVMNISLTLTLPTLGKNPVLVCE